MLTAATRGYTIANSEYWQNTWLPLTSVWKSAHLIVYERLTLGLSISRKLIAQLSSDVCEAQVYEVLTEVVVLPHVADYHVAGDEHRQTTDASLLHVDVLVEVSTMALREHIAFNH